MISPRYKYKPGINGHRLVHELQGPPHNAEIYEKKVTINGQEETSIIIEIPVNTPSGMHRVPIPHSLDEDLPPSTVRNILDRLGLKPEDLGLEPFEYEDPP